MCVFARHYKGENFKIDFFIYIVKFLYKKYQDEKCDIYGLPPKSKIEILYNHIKNKSHYDILTDLERFNDPCKKNELDIEKQLFSNLKAVSYYITLSKNLGLIGSKQQLTQDGIIFSKLKGSTDNFMSLSSKEQVLLAKKIFENDLVPILFNMAYTRLKNKYQLNNNEWQEIDDFFLINFDKYLEKREFKYKQSSWRNYIIVRQKWIEDLGLLSNCYFGIKPTYLKIIKSNPLWYKAYSEINQIVAKFENNVFKTLDRYRNFKKNLYNAYVKIKKNMVFSNIGYVNLYDIKKELALPIKEFEALLNRLAEDDNCRRKIFFNNIISAVDNRARFKVKNSAVLNINIIKALV